MKSCSSWAQEATLRSSGNIATAQIYFQNAITANLNKFGIAQGSINTYLAAHGTLPLTVAAAIDTVAAQEFITLYLNPEARGALEEDGYSFEPDYCDSRECYSAQVAVSADRIKFQCGECTSRYPVCSQAFLG